MRRSILVLTATALLGVAPSAHAAKSVYKGETSQDLSIKITLKGASIDKMVVYVKNNCGATDKQLKIGGPIEIADNGRFNAGLGDGAFTVGGRFQGDQVTGRLRERIPNVIVGSGKCDTGKVTFSASR